MLENFNEYMPLLLEGAKITVLLCVITLVFALPLGIPFALGVRSRIKPIKYLCECYVLIFRGTPLLLQLWFPGFEKRSEGPNTQKASTVSL